MAENLLSVEVREAGGKGAARQLRASGRIPAVIYGKGSQTRSLSLDPGALARLLAESGLNTLIDVEASNEAGFGKRTVLVKDLQREPVRGALMHADFYEVDLTRTVQVSVAVHISGTPIGVTQDAGILDHALREIEVECLPAAIPESVDVDVSALEIGGSIHVRDLTLPAGVELRTDPGLSVASVVAPAAAEEEAAPAEGEELEAGAEGAEAAEGAEGEGAKPEDGDAGKGDAAGKGGDAGKRGD